MRRAAGRARKGSKPCTQGYTERGNCGISIEGAGVLRGMRGTLVELLPRSCDEQQIYAHNECGGAWQHNPPSLPTARLGKHHLGLQVGTIGPILGIPRRTHSPLRRHSVYAIDPTSGHVLTGLSAFTGSVPGAST